MVDRYTQDKKDLVTYKIFHDPQPYEFWGATVADSPLGFCGKEGKRYFRTPGVCIGAGDGETQAPYVVWQEGRFYLIKVPGGDSWCQIGATQYRSTEYYLLELMPGEDEKNAPDAPVEMSWIQWQAHRKTNPRWMLHGYGCPGRKWQTCRKKLIEHAMARMLKRATDACL